VGLRPPVLVTDAAYGEVGEFRQGLDDHQIRYVVQVKADTLAYPEPVRPTTARYAGRGRRPQPRYRDKPCSLTQLALAAGQSAGVDVIWRRGQQRLATFPLAGIAVRPAGITPRRQAAARAGGVGWELPVPCKHAALAARRLEREGLARWDDGTWRLRERAQVRGARLLLARTLQRQPRAVLSPLTDAA
jgi:hypothetical protein